MAPTKVVVALNLPNEKERNQACAQRLSCLSNLAGGIIHELHNSLGAISSNINALKLYKSRSNTEHLDYTKKSLARMQHMTKMLTLYTRDAIVELSPVPVRQVMESEVSHMISANAYPDVRVHWGTTLAGKHCALTNEFLLREAIRAILTNACEAMDPNGGDLHLSFTKAKASTTHTEAIKLGCLNPSGTYLCCCMEDTGCGIPAGHFPLIFDPYYTTKMRARGIGLAYVVGLVLQTNAALLCESTPQEGSCFALYLPMA